MKKVLMPKKPKETFVPLLAVQIGRAFEDELLNAVVPYKEPQFSKQPQGQVFRDALQRHIWDPNFPHILKSPRARLLGSLREQWRQGKDFCLVVFWLWKCTHNELFEEVWEWLEKQDPPAPQLYSDAFEKTTAVEDVLSGWAETFAAQPEHHDKIKFTMAILLYSAEHPELFKQFENTEKPTVPVKPEREFSSMKKNHGSHWEAILVQLEKTASDRFQMEEFERFVERAHAIVADKIDQHTNDQQRKSLLAEVQKALAALIPWEGYFKFQDHKHWPYPTQGLEVLKSAATQLASLNTQLEQLDRLRKAQPSSRDERRTREQEISRAEDAIVATYHDLNKLFLGINSDTPHEQTASLPKNVLADSPQLDGNEAGMAARGEEDGTILAATPSATDEDSNTIKADLTSEPAPTALQSEPKVGLPVPLQQDEQADSLPESAITDQPDRFERLKWTDPEASDSIQQDQKSADSAPEFLPSGAEPIQRGLLSRVAEGNLPRAYWIALSQEQHAHEPLIPSWLLAGVQGTHWFLARWPNLPYSLSNEIRDIAMPTKRIVPAGHSVLGLSLALGIGVYAGGDGWEDWLSVELPALELNNLLTEADTFTRAGNRLEPGIVHHVMGREQVETRLQDLAQQAASWIEQAPQRGTRFPGADEVWKRIVGSKGVLHSWFDIVAQDHRKSVNKVCEQLENWEDRAWLDNLIQKLNRERRGGGKSIDGGARDQLIFWLLKASEIARQWSDLIQDSNTETGKRRWLREQTTHFCDFLRKNLPKSISEVRELSSRSIQPLERISFSLLEQTLLLFAKNLELPVDGLHANADRYIDSCSLEENLAEALMFYPELSLHANGFPVTPLDESQLTVLMTTEHSAGEAFDMWLKRKNYYFLQRLIDRMPETSQDQAQSIMNEQRSQDIRFVEREADKTTECIEQALVEDLMSEQDYISDKSNVESIRKQLKMITVGSSDAQTVDFEVLLKRLSEIQQKFENSHNDRLANFRRHWDRLQPLLTKFITKEADSNRVIELVERGFQQKDLRAVAEAIAHLDNAATGNEKFAPDLFTEKQVTYLIREFHADLLPMIKALDSESLQNEGARNSELLPAERKREVQQALGAWVRLKREENKNAREQNFAAVMTIMRYLGWDVESENSISLVPQPPVGFQHWRVLASTRISAPVPQFGSDRTKETAGRTGIYDIVGAWGRPGFDAIEALANYMGKKPFILLYFGRMQGSQRLDLIRLARKKQHPFLVVDELLMLFLAKEYDVRISAMFDCTLPYSSVNPYAPFATGSVPPEMYFGREDKIADLENPYGPSIVYGGRQLGKSALLRQVQRRFHKPEHGQFAIYEDIRLVGDPLSEKDYRVEITERLLNALRTGRVLEPSRQEIDISRLADLLIHQIKAKGWRVILLIDEADMFLEADAGRTFAVVTTLKRVMDQTDRMFKVVFAGLHHVQQFTKTSNQPLAHLGDAGAIKVGPLEPLSAIELIEKPLRSLGYVFGKPGQEDTSLIAHILSYTNYHPGLLQLFGQFLVDHLNQKSYGSLHPPYSITRADIEAVYRISKVREIIRDRFNITLALDERYEAITLSLILEQWDEKNGFDRLFSPEELLHISREHWAAGFGEDITVFKGFLEEMCGLGALSSVSLEDENVKYRLRSPNLVSLMGTESEIINRLDVISKSEPISQKRKLESYHAPVESYFSPLTYAQERVIVGSRSGVCMVFGNQSTHINNLSETLKRTARTIGDWYEIKVSARTENTLREQLKGLIKKSEKPIIAFRELEGSSEEMVEQILAATRLCRQSRDKKIRVVFALDSVAAWKWFQLTPSRRLEIEQGYVEIVTNLARWDKLGIRQLLEQHDPEIPAGDANIKRIYEATGGWPNVMDKFIDLCRNAADPLPALEQLRRMILTEPHRQRFVADLGLYDNTHVISFLDSIYKEKDLKSLTVVEAMDYLFGNDDLEQAQNMLDYLRRLSIVQTVPHLRIEPVVARLLYGSDH